MTFGKFQQIAISCVAIFSYVLYFNFKTRRNNIFINVQSEKFTYRSYEKLVDSLAYWFNYEKAGRVVV